MRLIREIDGPHFYLRRWVDEEDRSFEITYYPENHPEIRRLVWVYEAVLCDEWCDGVYADWERMIAYPEAAFAELVL